MESPLYTVMRVVIKLTAVGIAINTDCTHMHTHTVPAAVAGHTERIASTLLPYRNKI